MRLLRYLIPVFILFISISAFSQESALNGLIQKNQKLIAEFPTEKVYLHFDKPYYAIGDTIWFKGYLATGQNIPSDISKVLYVDVISETDTLIRTLKMPVVNTSAYGQLVLDPAVYKSGNIRFRAYTYWMINWDAAYFFNKTVYIGNALNRRVITHVNLKPVESASPTIQADIVFKDPDGKPFANKKLSWNLISTFETIGKGRAVTDDKGAVSLTLTAKQQAALDTGYLETILDTEERLISSNFPLKNTFAEADIQFFPEGGDLIQDLTGKVAFKAIDEKGLGLDVKGDILDNTGKVITSFKSRHLGMGDFSIAPEAGKTYSARVTFGNNISRTINLPAVKASGLSVSALTSSEENINIRISSNPAFFDANRDQSYFIVARNKGVVCYAAQLKLSSPLVSAPIPKNKFPEGIVQVTMFNSAMEPLSERLVFVKHAGPLVVSVNSDKKTYAGRSPVNLNINAKTSGAPIQGNFSLSVIAERNVPFNEDDEVTILSSFLLSSELKGFVEKPNYYFNAVNDKKLADLDLLMMTQGYRRFTYKEISSGQDPRITFIPEQGTAITGVLRSSNGMPVSKGSLRISVPQSRYYAETNTNVRGEFRFEKVNVMDSAEVTITARNAEKDDNMMIMLDGMAYPEVDYDVNNPNRVLNIDSLLNPYLLNSKRQYMLSNQLLQEVVVKASALPKVSHKDYPSLSGLSPIADHVMDGERFKGCSVLLSCLQSGAMGLTYVDNQFFVTRSYNAGQRVPVAIFVNGMNVDINYLSGISSNSVDNIEIFLKDDMGLVNRAYNTNGVLVINLKDKPKGTQITAEELRNLLPKRNTLTFSPLGYIKTRDFYSPKYLTPASKTAGSDLRTTIYWNPKIFTDEQGNMSVQFYTGDNKGNYKAVVEGTDIDGNLARTIYRYVVQ